MSLLNRRIKTFLYICLLFFGICIINIIRPRTQRHTITVPELRAREWISYFPNLVENLDHWEKMDSERLTSPQKTSLKLKDRHYRRGDVLHATITAFDEAGERKRYGGDFFFVTLRRPNFPIDGVTCETTDNLNGSYSVACILPWAGQATVRAILLHPSESIFQLMKTFSSERHHGINIYTKMKNSRDREENSVCSIAFPDKRPDEVCNYSNPTHGEKRTCLKPSSGECSRIIWQETGEDPGLKTVYDRHYFREGYNFKCPIHGDGITISVGERRQGAIISKSKIQQTTSHDPMTPTGWFYDSIWISLKPKARQDQAISPKTCARNKRLYFIGDSTMRMIYRQVLKKLELNDSGLDNSVAWSRGRDVTDEALNLTMQYRSHGPPLLNPGPEDSHPYISDTLDAISTGGKGSVVILTLGYHFHTLTPEVFLNRLQIIKEVMRDMMHRLPGIRVVIKGLHYHARDVGDRLWLTYRLEVLMRKQFADIPGVTYVELWDWTLVCHNKALHPQSNTLEHMIHDIVTAIC